MTYPYSSDVWIDESNKSFATRRFVKKCAGDTVLTPGRPKLSLQPGIGNVLIWTTSDIRVRKFAVLLHAAVQNVQDMIRVSLVHATSWVITHAGPWIASYHAKGRVEIIAGFRTCRRAVGLCSVKKACCVVFDLCDRICTCDVARLHLEVSSP